MTTLLEFNPNLRVDGGACTIVDLHQDRLEGPVPSVGELVHIVEPVSGLRGVATVKEVDVEEQALVLIVDWEALVVNRGWVSNSELRLDRHRGQLTERSRDVHSVNKWLVGA